MLSLHSLKLNKRKVTTAVCLASSLFLLSGCSLFDRSEATDNTGKVVVTDVNKLENDSYYVKSKDTYTKAYLGQHSFQTAEASYNSSGAMDGDPTRVIWLDKDIENVPTMRRGDSIVFHSNKELVTTLGIERFNDLGYSIGIAKLEGGDDGRYRLNLDPSALTIDTRSQAKSLMSIADKDTVTIDSIGKTPLRSGNVTTSGTIKGLKKGKTYAVNAYLGTNKHTKNIEADVKVLGSTETYKITKYEFSENKTIEFKFPSFFNSGYYLVNGFGVVKYIADDDAKDDDNLDMNIPNIYPKDGESNEDKNVGENNVQAEDLVTSTVTIEESGKNKISISYSDLEGKDNKSKDNISAKLITPSGVAKFKKDKGNTLSVEADLDKGDYEVQIVGLGDRSYTYRVTAPSKKETKQKPKEKATATDVAGPSEDTNTSKTSSEKKEKSTKSDSDKEKAKSAEGSKSLADLVNGN